MARKNTLPVERIQQSIFVIRGMRVMLDVDLAFLYGVETKALNQAVKRNLSRFPPDFMFQLTKDEFEDLRSQFVTFNSLHRRYLPYAFTEQGVAMLSSVLNSERAISVNILIMRAFVKLRNLLTTNETLARKISEIEGRLRDHDQAIAVLFEEIRQLLSPPEEPAKGRIGFKTDK